MKPRFATEMEPRHRPFTVDALFWTRPSIRRKIDAVACDMGRRPFEPLEMEWFNQLI